MYRCIMMTLVVVLVVSCINGFGDTTDNFFLGGGGWGPRTTGNGGGGEPPEPDPPVAEFSGVPLSGDAPLTVAFTDLSTNTPTSWAWDFGDLSPGNNEQSPSHEYADDGTYTVTLTATNAAGFDDEVKVDYITADYVPPPPVADFSGTPLSGDEPLTVVFTDLSTNTPTSWEWDFGDLSALVYTQNPTHEYADFGTYTVTLTATNAGGFDDEVKTDYVTVDEVTAYPSVISFTWSATGKNFYVTLLLWEPNALVMFKAENLSGGDDQFTPWSAEGTSQAALSIINTMDIDDNYRLYWQMNPVPDYDGWDEGAWNDTAVTWTQPARNDPPEGGDYER